MKKPKKTKPRKKRAGRRLAKAAQRDTVWLNVLPHDLWLEVSRGTNLLQALQDADIEIDNECGGLGKCGKCKVRVLTAIGAPLDVESRAVLSDEDIAQGIRLACRVLLKKDLAVYIGESEPELEYFQILKTGHAPVLELQPLVIKRQVDLTTVPPADGVADLDRIRKALGPGFADFKGTLHFLRSLPPSKSRGTAVLHGHSLLAWQNQDSVNHHFGLVFDLGTSTLVGKLIDLSDGKQVAAISRLNRQNRYGADVISRLQFIKEEPEGLERLHQLLVDDLHRITLRLLEVTELKPHDICIAVAAGNTTMQHLLLRLNPVCIAEAPFSPVLTDGLVVRAVDAGLALHPEARLYVMPCRSGYIGGDLISVILASEAAEQEEQIILGLDLGTNGEIFLGNRRRLLTCSAAAGPALEGAKISHGTIAKAGAIEGVRFQDGRLSFKDIGNIPPTGICGSGLVDLVAVLANIGVIDREGLIQPPANDNLEKLRQRVIERDGVNDFLVASAEESYHKRPIYLTQKDVREVQYAKGAIASGIQILLDEWGIGTADIGRVYLAGALGNYINPFSAMRIGLLPMVDPQIVSSLGNAASTGGSMVLLSRPHWRKAMELAGAIEHVELSTRADFSRHFVDNLDFPERNPWERRERRSPLRPGRNP